MAGTQSSKDYVHHGRGPGLSGIDSGIPGLRNALPGCMAAQFENIEQGCPVHGIDPDMLVKSINDAIEAV